MAPTTTVRINTAAMVSMSEKPHSLFLLSANLFMGFIGASHPYNRAQRNRRRVGVAVLAYRQGLARRHGDHLGPRPTGNLGDIPTHVADHLAVGSAYRIGGLVSGNRSLAEVN